VAPAFGVHGLVVVAGILSRSTSEFLFNGPGEKHHSEHRQVACGPPRPLITGRKHYNPSGWWFFVWLTTTPYQRRISEVTGASGAGDVRRRVRTPQEIPRRQSVVSKLRLGGLATFLRSTARSSQLSKARARFGIRWHPLAEKAVIFPTTFSVVDVLTVRSRLWRSRRKRIWRRPDDFRCHGLVPARMLADPRELAANVSDGRQMY
jgi:hypothetical protein